MTTPTSQTEKCFGPTEIDPIPARTGSGVVVTGQITAHPTDELLGWAASGAPLWWLPAADVPLEVFGLAAAARDGVRTLALVPDTGDPRAVGLASAFSGHLASVRAHLEMPAVFLTSASQPQPCEGAIPVPHLVATTALGGADAVVWEVMPLALAQRWLDELPPQSDRDFVEDHLPVLLRLRQAARAGELPATPAGHALTRLLRTRYLSVRLVYQRTSLVRELVNDLSRSSQ